MQARSILAVSAVLMMWPCAVAIAAKPQISITISTNSSTVKAGSDIYLKIEMTNNSDYDVDCTRVYTDSGVDLRYHYDVKDLSGKLVSKRARRHPEIGEVGSIYPCTLAPGKSTGAKDSRISSLFDMSKPGKYSIQVWRLEEGNAVVRSNTIQITVTP